MIPFFPNFKLLEINDKDDIEEITGKFEPYSDFNFVSMWVYNTAGEMKIARLGANLAVKFTDYLTEKPFYSLIGDDDIEKSLDVLLKYSQSELKLSYLKLVPESVVSQISGSLRWVITEDPDNFDYVVSVPDLVELKGGKYMSKRNHIHSFERNYGEKIRVLEMDVNDIYTQELMVKLFSDWEKSRGKAREDTQIEMEAVNRLFLMEDFKNIRGVGLWMESELIGFSVCEILPNNFAIYHFEKADVMYKGVFSYLKHATAQRLYEQGITLWNLEQDLGDLGLRISKSECRPVKMLKKYIVSSNDQG